MQRFFSHACKRSISHQKLAFQSMNSIHRSFSSAAQPDGNTPPAQPQSFIEHVFIRFDYKSSLFNNSLTISMPENTPGVVVETARVSLSDALKDRPTGQDYSSNKLAEPEFVQTGVSWNRYMWNLMQREVEGSLDPYTVQGIILDALVNRLQAKIIGNTSLGNIGNESYTYIISVPVAALDYTYKRL